MQLIPLIITAVSIILVIISYQKVHRLSRELNVNRRLLQEEINSRLVIESELKEKSEPQESSIIQHAEMKHSDSAGYDKNLMRELLENNNRLQLVMEASETGFADIFPDSSKNFFNPIILKQLGYTKDELLAMWPRWRDYIHVNDIKNVDDAISALLAGNTDTAEFTHRFLTASGHWEWLLTKARIVEKGKDDIPERMLIVTEDVSLRKKAEEEILLNLAKEQELAEMRSRLVTLVSHEFRTPISTILSSVELIETYGEKISREKMLDYFEKIKKSIDYLVGLLNEVSLMSKTEASALAFKPEKAELISLFEEFIEEQKGIYKSCPSIHFNANRKVFQAEYDTKLLRYIFINLLSNAIKYTPADKNIYIYCIINTTEIFFSISDEGIGIPKEEQKRLFTPFTRAYNVGEIKGSGLGLSIVKRTIDICQGRIYFESELNKGTSFKVILPMHINRKGIITDEQPD
jgi:PAS domain S-box-containing protein